MEVDTLLFKLHNVELSAVKTLASNLAQDVDGCSTSLSTLKQNLLNHNVVRIANTVLKSHIRMEHINDIMDQNGTILALIHYLWLYGAQLL